MNLLTASDLSAMRLTAAEALDSTAVIQTETFVSDGGGGGTASWVASGTVACRFAPVMRGIGEDVEGERLTDVSEVIFTFPAETTIAHDQQIVSGGQTFAVLAIRNRSEELTRRVKAKVIE